MNKIFSRILVLILAVVVLGGCGLNRQPSDGLSSHPNPSQAGFKFKRGFICPNDYAITPVRAPSAGFTTAAACNTARAAPAACAAVTVPAPNGPCNTYCAANWWACLGSVINPTTITGNSCYMQPNGKHYFMCMATADCHCV